MGCAQSSVSSPTVAMREQPPECGPERNDADAETARKKNGVTHRKRMRTVDLGRSVHGVPIQMHVFGDSPNTTLVFGGIHGSEPTSAYVAARLTAHLRGHPEVYAGTSVAVLAAANPDGLERHRRGNARHVDLNRNFPATNWRKGRPRSSYYGGATAASEPETRAIIRAVELTDPARVIAIHAMNGGPCNNYDGPAKVLAELMRQFNDYPVRATMGYPTPGSFGSWAGVDRRIPTITLELKQGKAGPRCWEENREALLAAIQSNSATVGK